MHTFFSNSSAASSIHLMNKMNFAFLFDVSCIVSHTYKLKVCLWQAYFVLPILTSTLEYKIWSFDFEKRLSTRFVDQDILGNKHRDKSASPVWNRYFDLNWRSPPLLGNHAFRRYVWQNAVLTSQKNECNNRGIEEITGFKKDTDTEPPSQLLEYSSYWTRD